MQGPYMELVKKLTYKKILKLKSVSDKNKKIHNIIKKKMNYEYFFSDYNKILTDANYQLLLLL